MPFSTKITHKRFSLLPFTPEDMKGIGDAVIKSVQKRILAGIKVDDSQARPLKGDVKSDKYIPYAEQKVRKGLAGIRNWTWSGKTLKSMQVLSASEDKAVVGFVGDRANRIVAKMNQIDRMFGVAESDQRALQDEVQKRIQSKQYIKLD